MTVSYATASNADLMTRLEGIIEQLLDGEVEEGKISTPKHIVTYWSEKGRACFEVEEK